MISVKRLLPIILASLVSASAAHAKQGAKTIGLTETADGVRITYGGELFADYVCRSGTRPIVWPLVGPTGEPMTRRYPMLSAGANEATDHPHHRSLWFGHEGVGGANSWLEPRKGEPLRDPLGEVVHRQFDQLDCDGDQATVVSTNDWRDAAGNKVCEDQRTLRFFATPDYRWIDFTIRLSATEADVPIADTKEGTFAVRVAGTMKVDAKLGGRIATSRGLTNGKAWGQPAEWVDYSGPVKGQRVGIAMLSHPTNFRPAPRWHVRTYGLFAANPFGEKDFPRLPDYKQGAYTIRQGESLQLRYRVVLHRGDEVEGEVAKRFGEFAAD
jgi:hypothetical protein